MRKALQEKMRRVEELGKLLNEYRNVGVFYLEGVPANQIQVIRKELRGEAVIKVEKQAVIERAIENHRKELEKLLPFMEGKPVGIILTDLDPFKLYGKIRKIKTKAPAKPGMVAPNDILVPAGETELPAGPALSELKAAGLPVKIDKGKIVVEKDTVIAKKGDVITPEIASALAKLDIKPIELTLKIAAIYEDGIVYTPEVLEIDEEQVFNDFVTCARHAFNLSVEIAYPVKENIEVLIAKAHRDAYALSLETWYPTKDNIEELLQKAERIALSLK